MKLQLTIYIFFAFYVKGFSCDDCSGFLYGLYPNKTYVGLQYRYRVFNGYDHLNNHHRFSFSKKGLTNSKTTHHPGVNFILTNPNKADYERYFTTELLLNYNLADNYNFSLRLPYQSAEVYFKEAITLTNPITDTLFTFSGIGDMVISANRYNVFNQNKWVHTFYQGLGIKLPTGKFKLDDNQGSGPVAFFQTGTGSFDFLLQIKYGLVYKERAGISLMGNYKISTQRKQEYRFGNRFSGSGSLFYRLNFGKWTLTPHAGLFIEIAATDFYLSNEITSTGGNTLMLQTGLDVQFQNITFFAQWYGAVTNQLNGNQIGSSGIFYTGLLFSFKSAFFNKKQITGSL